MTPDPTKMSPECTQTVRRVSYPGHGNRPSGGSPRHKSRGSHPQQRTSPKSQYYQQGKASTPPARHPSFAMATRDDGVNNNGSPTGGLSNFAGSKFNEAPSPDLLPRPPAHWLANGLSTNTPSTAINQNMTRNLKFMLKVPVQS